MENLQNRYHSYAGDEVRNSVLKAFIWMFVGVAVSGITAYLFYASGLMLYMYQYWYLPLILIVAQIAVGLSMIGFLNKLSATALKVLFMVYAVVSGISLSSLAYTYADSTIAFAFLISAIYYLALVFIGFTTKIDLTRFGNVFMIGLVVLIICEAISLFFPIPMMSRIISIGGLLLFSGITAYDVQRLNQTMLYSQGQPVLQNKWAIFFAFELYLDFINIFIYILELMGDSSSSSRN